MLLGNDEVASAQRARRANRPAVDARNLHIEQADVLDERNRLVDPCGLASQASFRAWISFHDALVRYAQRCRLLKLAILSLSSACSAPFAPLRDAASPGLMRTDEHQRILENASRADAIVARPSIHHVDEESTMTSRTRNEEGTASLAWSFAGARWGQIFLRPQK